MINKAFSVLRNKVQTSLSRRVNDTRIREIARIVAGRSVINADQKPIIFFNASTRLGGLSLNAGFSLISAWALRLQGIPIIHFVCKSGMSRCVLGTYRDNLEKRPPCKKCIAQSTAEYDYARVIWFDYHPDSVLEREIEKLTLLELEEFTYKSIPLGKIVMPALRWELRKHHLADDQSTQYLYREFILSAWNVARNFTKLLEQITPQAVVVFNGQFFPEAVVRYIARERGIRTVAHEVGLLPFTAFFTDGDATAYPIDIPVDYVLSEKQNHQLDRYLEKRFQGNFKMAGIQFWQGMKPLSPELINKMAGFKQTIPVFTNVIFDTSQPHSNVVFSDMFSWLDTVLKLAKEHPETLFVIRAHPDELRPGTAKQSRETVRDWVKSSGAAQQQNIHFIDALEYVSSYELIQKSKFVMVYNSSIGLEAAIMGAAVLSAGKSRYTSYPTVFFPQTITAYLEKAEELLSTKNVDVPLEFIVNARKFLYFQLFKTALPFNDFLEESRRPGLVFMKKFEVEQLSPDKSETLQVITEGLIENKSFLLGDG
jgi:hypothetical protein